MFHTRLKQLTIQKRSASTQNTIGANIIQLSRYFFKETQNNTAFIIVKKHRFL